MTTALVRTIILYSMVVLVLRIMGKRQIGQLEPTELVVTILISEIAAVPMQDPGIPIISGMIIPIFTLGCLEMLMTGVILKSHRFRALMCGKPSIVVENGQILENQLRKNRLTTDELIEELRLKNITDINQVKYAILETNGQLSPILYPGVRQATASDLGISPEDNGLPIIMINDGRVLEQNLKLRNVDMAWLEQQVRDNGGGSTQDVLLLTVDEKKHVYFMAKEKPR